MHATALSPENEGCTGEPAGAALPDRRRALLLVNPMSRRGGSSARRVAARLQAAGFSVEQETFPDRGSVSAGILRRRKEVDCVVICGGDGTLNAAAQGVIESGLPIGIVPVGTANDLARTLGIPSDLDRAVDVIAAGQCRPIDVGMVNGHPFFNVASIGLSVELARALTPGSKRVWGRLGYAFAAVKALTRSRPFTAAIRAKGATTKVRTLQIAVGNGRYYGGGMAVETTAAIDDRHLDLYSLEMSSFWKLASRIIAFRNGSLGSGNNVRTIRCTEFEIETRKPRPINLDGELVTTTPARFTIKPAAITVFAPPANPESVSESALAGKRRRVLASPPASIETINEAHRGAERDFFSALAIST